MAADQEFFIVRRFGALNTRVILALQDEITQCEQKLDMIDIEYSRKAQHPSTNNGSFRFDPSDERRSLIHDTLLDKLLKYNKFINEYRNLVTRAAVDPADIRKVKAWFNQLHPGAIEEIEQDFITHKDDLIPILPKVKSRFRNFLESTLLRAPIIRRYFDREPLDDIDIIDDIEMVWYSDTKVERFYSIVVGVGGLSMLIGPLWILVYVNESTVQLGVITSFISLFFILLTVATVANIYEPMAATAAYAAVLMVFVQTGSS
ncbi:hypothetical protein MMC29_004581 [Sticta canariensis]|nr:hypothetical protein [Sticta canariensis]